MSRYTSTPGCSLCGLLVTSPHWCVAAYETAHKRVLDGNQRWAQARATEHASESPDDACHDLLDLTLWGEVRAARTDQAHPGARARVARVWSALAPSVRAELERLYVQLATCERNALRRPLQHCDRTKGTLPPLTSAELAYLRAVAEWAEKARPSFMYVGEIIE